MEEGDWVTIGGKIILITIPGEKKQIKIDDGDREYLCESEKDVHLEVDDLISFRTNVSRVGKQGNYKNKIIYEVPREIVIEMAEDDESIRRAFVRANYNEGNKAYYELLNIAEENNQSLAEYLYENAEYEARVHHDKCCAWWVKNRIYRRLWNLGLERDQIEEYTEALHCKVADLYPLLTKSPGPLYTFCFGLELSLDLCKRFNINYTKDDVYLARISRFIYECTSKLRHSCVGKKTVKGHFKDIDDWEKVLLDRFSIRLVKWPHIRTSYYYLEYNYQVTQNVTDILAKMSTTQNSVPIVPTFTETDIIDIVQKECVTQALNNRLFGIFGGGGSGKTTTLKYLIRELLERGIRVGICAPTGTATVHLRDDILGISGGIFDEKIKQYTMTLKMLITKGNLISVEHVIIDEISMVSHDDIYKLMLTHPEIRSITIAGDDKQLQPIPWGHFMKELLKSEIFPHIKLKVNYRSKNKIIQFDKYENLKASEHLQLISGGVDEVISTYGNLLKEGYKARDIITLTPTRRGVDELNEKTQEMLQSINVTPTLKDRKGKKFSEGDKVILLQNNYQIEQMNGDIGIIIDVNEKSKTMVVEFAAKSEIYKISTSTSGNKYSYHGDGDEMTTDVLSLAHSVTIHKSQSGQWPIVIIFVPEGKKHQDFFNFHLLYTSFSRTMVRCIVIGAIQDVKEFFNKKPEEKLDHFGKLFAYKYNKIMEERNLTLEAGISAISLTNIK